jgi:hypothetical protein
MEVRERPRGMSVETAIEKAIRTRPELSAQTLADAYAGRHGGLNRARRANPPKLTKASKRKK